MGITEPARFHSLTDDVLLQICRVQKDDPQVTPAWLATVKAVPRILAERRLREPERLEAAVTLLTSALGGLKQYNPTHFPFGYAGEAFQPVGWVERNALERVATQIVGLLWSHATAETVSDAVHEAVSDCVRLGFLDQREYDAWRPGMRSGAGWRAKVSATPYGVIKATNAATSPADVEAADSVRADSGQPEESPVESRVSFSEQQAVSYDASPAPSCAPCQHPSVAPARIPARSLRPLPRRGTRTANIEKLEKELEKHLHAARDHAHSLRDGGREPVLLPRPSQKELARRTDLSETDVSRCLNDNRATVLKLLWETSESLDAVMSYKRRR